MVLQLLVRLVKVIIDNDLVMNTRCLGELEFIVRLSQSLLHAGLGLGTTSSKARFQSLQRRRGNKNVSSSNAGLLDLLDPLFTSVSTRPPETYQIPDTSKKNVSPCSMHTHLHLNIKQHNFALLRLLLNRHLASPVAVPAKLGVFDEPILSNEAFKVTHRDIVVVDAVGLTRSRRPSGMRHGEAERIGMLREQAVVEGAFADA